MFDMIPQQNFCDMLKSLAFQGARRGGKATILNAVKALENARQWQPSVFAQAIDQVQPGAIWIDTNECIHVEGGAATLVLIVDAYLEMTGQKIREVV
ncbi:MAG: hypothetical protein ABI690_13470 [Chloroflexota bacterium]